nr:reverse transcriptase domain-containing protein [Tanacetum cinerariifolium]
MGVKNVQANVDSKLAANQVLGTYVAKENNMIKYREIAKGLAPFQKAGEGHVPDSRNELLHEVNRSKGGGNDYRRTGEEIRMGQYCMPLRYSGRNNIKQWQTVH